MIKTLLPSPEFSRKKILESGVTEEELDKLVAEKKKIAIFANNEALIYKLIAGAKTIEIPSQIQTFDIPKEESIETNKFLTLEEFDKTNLKLVNIAAYYMGWFKREPAKYGDKIKISIMDNTKLKVATVIGKKLPLFTDGKIPIGSPILISNVLVSDWTPEGSSDVIRWITVSDKTSVRIMSSDEVKHSLYDIATTSYYELEADKYYSIKGIIGNIEQYNVFVCDRKHILSVETAGASIRCDKDPCSNTMVIAKADTVIRLVVVDGQYEQKVVFYPYAAIDKQSLELGKGIIINGILSKDQDGNITDHFSGSRAIIFDALNGNIESKQIIEEEIKIPAEVKVVDLIKIDFGKLNFDCDKDAEEPTEEEILFATSAFKGNFRVFAKLDGLTPESLQDMLLAKLETPKRIKVKSIIAKLLFDGEVSIMENDDKEAAIQ